MSSLSEDICPSDITRKTQDKVLSAVHSNSSVLLLGESGSGKDFLARQIHDRSSRSKRPFLLVNCAAIPLSVAESELFGHERGAFTGSVEKREGFIEQANTGTLLLNEVGELSLPLQGKLLTFLDTSTFHRVGGGTQVKVDVRIIAATNRDIFADVEAKLFRLDLFYRLNVLLIEIPPLRQRKDDLPVLSGQILKNLATEMKLSWVPRLDDQALKVAFGYNWPGNVRELRNVLERCLLNLNGFIIGAELFSSALEIRNKDEVVIPAIIRELRARNAGKPIRQRNLSVEDRLRLKEECLNRQMTQIEIAEALGVSQPTVSRWLGA